MSRLLQLENLNSFGEKVYLTNCVVTLKLPLQVVTPMLATK